MDLIRRSEYLWEIPRTGGMRVPGRVVASGRLMDAIRDDVALKQVANVAHLPGIVGYSWAMPDCHMGYGFPIGGVAATAFDDEGVVSPGGVGYDINCGVRLVASGVTREEIASRIDNVTSRLFARIPCGPSPHESGMGHLSAGEMAHVFSRGARFAVERGFGTQADLEFSEEGGAMPGADPEQVSERAVERGRRQVGSLGSGNHFLEVGYVSEVCAPDVARVLGIERDTVTILIHTGSRGLGHQVCTDFLKEMASSPAELSLPDRQLASARLDSALGRRYLAAMAAAANFAWANRQTLMALAQRAVADAFGSREERLGFRLLYDVSHNIAKVETHEVGGRRRRVCVHRKGATRALPPHDERLPPSYAAIGQPVLVPGDMGTASHLCVGVPDAGEHPFHSSCHGAGRMLSRKAAVRKGRGRSIVDELRRRGVTVMAKNKRTLAEEMPEAYKDVGEVVDTLHNAGLLRKVAELRPLGVIKG
jgi:tRNA-splicing ligase RtcB